MFRLKAVLKTTDKIKIWNQGLINEGEKEII